MNSEMVKQGYKHTEVGVIPEEWSVHRLENILARLKNGAVYTATKNGGVPISRIETISSGKIDFEKVGFAEHSKQLEQYQLQPKDMLFSHINSLDHIGKVAIYNGPDPLFHGMNLLLLRAAEGVIPSFLFHWLDSPIGRQRTIVLAKQAVSQASISTSDLRVLPIPLPPKQEQSRIADVIDEADCLINKLDQLIAKKRDIKQATMQQLLTGQTRLPGFSGEWEETTFDQVVRHHSGNSSLIKGKLPDTHAFDLFPAFSASGQDVWCSHHEHEGDALVVSAVGSRCGKAFLASGKWTAIANTHVVWPREKKINIRFLGFFVNDELFWLKSGSGQPFVLFRQTFARKLRLPCLLEQEAIANAISDLCAELATLEARRDKTLALKQAMMQELLTGRIRLV